jgi:hypothetical protein
MNRRAVLVLLPLVTVSPGAWAQQKPLGLPAKWYVVQIEDGAFSVEMPGIPDHRVINDASARGSAFALHSYSLDAGGNSYVVQTAVYPRDVDVADPRRLLQAALDDRAGALDGGKWSKVDWRSVGGGAAAESTGQLKNGNVLRQLVLLKGPRLVTLAFMGPVVTGADAERFFRSLKMK